MTEFLRRFLDTFFGRRRCYWYYFLVMSVTILVTREATSKLILSVVFWVEDEDINGIIFAENLSGVFYTMQISYVLF